jgi:hypothetical protein
MLNFGFLNSKKRKPDEVEVMVMGGQHAKQGMQITNNSVSDHA